MHDRVEHLYSNVYHNPRWCDLEDFQAEGYFALRKAIIKFDPSKGVSFRTYASFLIHRHIREYVMGWMGLRSSRGKTKDRYSLGLRMINVTFNDDDIPLPIDMVLNVINIDLAIILNDEELTFIIDHIVNGIPLSRIGERYGVTRATACNRYNRAIAKVRRKLAGYV